MNQVYLLFRNNQQAGPFTLEELVRSGLQEQDLIWVEGKSTAWKHPAELPEVGNLLAPGHPHAAYLPGENGTSAPSQASRDDMQLFQSYEINRSREHNDYQSKTNPEAKDTEEPTQVFNRNKPTNRLWIFGILVVTAGAGYLGFMRFSGRTGVAGQSVSEYVDPVAADTVLAETKAPVEAPEAKNKKTGRSRKAVVPVNQTGKDAAAISTVPRTAERTIPDEPVPEVLEVNTGMNTDSTPVDAAPDAPDNRKGKKAGETVKSVVTKIKTRVGELRDEMKGSKTADMEMDEATLAGMIRISANEKAETWMIGISGLKLTMKNGSPVTVRLASVELSYFDENNQLLEKKLVRFSNIAAHSSQTVAAPDNKWADHVSFELKGATSRDDRYVKE